MFDLASFNRILGRLIVRYLMDNLKYFRMKKKQQQINETTNKNLQKISCPVKNNEVQKYKIVISTKDKLFLSLSHFPKLLQGMKYILLFSELLWLSIRLFSHENDSWNQMNKVYPSLFLKVGSMVCCLLAVISGGGVWSLLNN